MIQVYDNDWKLKKKLGLTYIKQLWNFMGYEWKTCTSENVRWGFQQMKAKKKKGKIFLNERDYIFFNS